MKDLKVYIIIATGLLVLYLMAQYNRPKALDWSETLSSTDKIPFGTYVLYNQLNDIFPGAKVQMYREPVYNVLTDHGISTGGYIIIANSINLNEYDYKKITTFIKNGNDVFIASSYFGEFFRKKLKIQTSSGFKETKTRLYMHPTDTNKYLSFDKEVADTYFSSVDTTKAIALGANNWGETNFVKYPIGKGTLYLNANPLLFSNYSILGKQGPDYAEKALSYMRPSSIVIWDQYYSQGREGEDNNMRVFLKYPDLKWAFYLAFFGLVVFVLYQMKRTQRIIPVIEPLKNASLEFVTVVGRVYYENRDNANIARKKVLYFLEYLRDTHQIKTSTLDAEFVERLTAKLDIEPATAKELVDYMVAINSKATVTDGELIKLNKLIENLYMQ